MDWFCCGEALVVHGSPAFVLFHHLQEAPFAVEPRTSSWILLEGRLRPDKGLFLRHPPGCCGCPGWPFTITRASLRSR